MSSDRGGLLKTRAENFARNLQNRLRNLRGSEDSTWTDTASVDSEVYYDIDSSLASPEEEVTEPIFIAVNSRDTLPIVKRSDSEVSTYFDTVEDVGELAAIQASSSVESSLKNLPINILQLKQEERSTHLMNGSTPITNGNGHVDNFDSSSTNFDPTFKFEQEIMENENNLNGCIDNIVDEYDTIQDFQGDEQIFEIDIEDEDEENCLEENNNLEDEIVVVDLNSNCNLDLIKSDVTQLSIDNRSEEIAENPDSQFCVFCDIEQIKSSLSNVLSEERLPSKKVDVEVQNERETLRQNEKRKNGEESTFLPQPDNVTNNDWNASTSKSESAVNNLQSDAQLSISDDERLSFQDLLTVLKEEIISNDIETKNILENTQPENEKDSSELLRPSIEVTEPSSSSSEAKPKIVDEEFDIEEKRKHFRRSSSLRSGKTPPSTPGRKKIVRFADVLGLDLADVKTFLDEVPTIPMSAFDDLHGIDLTPSKEPVSINKIIVATPQVDRILSPLFQQPCIQPNFLDRVRENNICLENAMVSDTSMFAITGLVRVKNMDFHKSVYVRYTINGWKSFSDLQARYVANSCDGFSDKFTFVLYAHTLGIGQRLQFAVRFHTAGAQFWDSNGGLNYIFECTSLLPKTIAAPPLPTCPTETASFY